MRIARRLTLIGGKLAKLCMLMALIRCFGSDGAGCIVAGCVGSRARLFAIYDGIKSRRTARPRAEQC